MLFPASFLIVGRKSVKAYKTGEFFLKVVIFFLTLFLQCFWLFREENLYFTSCYTERRQNVLFHYKLLILGKKVCYIYETDEFFLKVVFFCLTLFLQCFLLIWEENLYFTCMLQLKQAKMCSFALSSS